MPNHKVIFRYRPALGALPTANSNNGWTETFYHNQDVDDGACVVIARALLAARRLVLTPGWRCRSITAYRWPNSRAALGFSIDPAEGRGSYPLNPGVVYDEQPYDVCIVSLPSGVDSPRYWGMRGIGSDVIDAGGTYVAPGKFVANFAKFRQALVNNNWAIRNADRVDARPGIFPTAVHIDGTTVAGMTGTPQSPVLEFAGTGVGLSWGAGTTVKAGGYVTLRGLNGTWVTMAAQINGLNSVAKLTPKRQHYVDGLFDAGGYWWKVNFFLRNIIDASPGDGSSHRVGGLPGRRRGRRRRPRS